MDQSEVQIMKRPVAEVVLAGMQPMTYYRPKDIASDTGVNVTTARAALRELTRGGVIDVFREPCRTVYLTRQLALFQ
jgi:ribosomal protein S25